MAVLFTGPPGTGKTLAAQAVATELGVELLTVDLSAVVDKYIGETEKNLERVFRSAEILNCVLFFDEADALFGSRTQVTDARDKYANQETAWLLQRIETFDGLAILATNLRANLDRAFTRRLNFVVPFDAPGPDLRRLLWRRFLADVTAVDPEDPLDIEQLAAHAEITGGEIRNIVLSAVHDVLLPIPPSACGISSRPLLASTTSSGVGCHRSWLHRNWLAQSIARRCVVNPKQRTEKKALQDKKDAQAAEQKKQAQPNKVVTVVPMTVPSLAPSSSKPATGTGQPVIEVKTASSSGVSQPVGTVTPEQKGVAEPGKPLAKEPLAEMKGLAEFKPRPNPHQLFADERFSYQILTEDKEDKTARDFEAGLADLLEEAKRAKNESIEELFARRLFLDAEGGRPRAAGAP